MPCAVMNGFTTSGTPAWATPLAAGSAGFAGDAGGAAFAANHFSRIILNAISCRGAGVLFTSSRIPSKSAFSLSSNWPPNTVPLDDQDTRLDGHEPEIRRCAGCRVPGHHLEIFSPAQRRATFPSVLTLFGTVASGSADLSRRYFRDS